MSLASADRLTEIFGDSILDVSGDPGITTWRRLMAATVILLVATFVVAAVPVEHEHLRCLVQTQDDDEAAVFKVVTRDDLTDEQAKSQGLECRRHRFRFQWFEDTVLNPPNP